MLEDHVPSCKVHHFRDALFKYVWTLWQTVQYHITSEPNPNLLEYEGAFSNHHYRHLFILITCPQPLAFFLVCVFTDHRYLGIS